MGEGLVFYRLFLGVLVGGGSFIFRVLKQESRMVYLAIVRYKFAKTRQVDNSKHYDTKNTLTPW